MRLAEPFWLALLILAATPFLWEKRRPRVSWFSVPTQSNPRHRPPFWVILPTWLKSIAIVLVVLALARPQTQGGVATIRSKGIAFMIVLDRSSSMSQRDASQNSTRLQQAIQALQTFANQRPNDWLGLTVFANYPDLICPPTLDQRFFQDSIAAIQPVRPTEDGTNLGDAIVWAAEALSKSKPDRKVLILLTDGVNSPATPNPIEPLKAVRMARALEISLYAIAFGPNSDTNEPGADFKTLKTLADAGDGEALTAADVDGLQIALNQIDQRESNLASAQIRVSWHDQHQFLILAACIILIWDRVISSGRAREIP